MPINCTRGATGKNWPTQIQAMAIYLRRYKDGDREKK